MELRLKSEKPIYVQLCEWLSDMIISGVNPATALKGINMLVDKGVIFKKRGLGMFVSVGAVEKLKAERQQDFQQTYVDKMCEEAKKLGISKNEIIAMIERGFENE